MTGRPLSVCGSKTPCHTFFLKNSLEVFGRRYGFLSGHLSTFSLSTHLSSWNLFQPKNSVNKTTGNLCAGEKTQVFIVLRPAIHPLHWIPRHVSCFFVVVGTQRMGMPKKGKDGLWHCIKYLTHRGICYFSIFGRWTQVSVDLFQSPFWWQVALKVCPKEVRPGYHFTTQTRFSKRTPLQSPYRYLSFSY